MGIPTGSITKYLATAKATLLRVMRAHPAARVGFFEDQQVGYAAHRALEEQHYKCPVTGVWYAFSIDGTVTQIFAPEDPELALIYFAGSKHVHGVNSVILVSPLGLIHAFRLCLPGNTPDGRAAQPIFEWLFDPVVNPNNFGVLVDYGFTQFCHPFTHVPPVARPFQPKKDKQPTDKNARVRIAEFSAWVTTCRQYSEWFNSSFKRAFPRMTMKIRLDNLPQLQRDMELVFLCVMFDAQTANWRADAPRSVIHTRPPLLPTPPGCTTTACARWGGARCATRT